MLIHGIRYEQLVGRELLLPKPLRYYLNLFTPN